MNTSDLRELTDEVLLEELEEAREEKFNLRFQLATNQLDNTARIKEVKRDIARILTVLRERELASPAEAGEVGVPGGTPASGTEEKV